MKAPVFFRRFVAVLFLVLAAAAAECQVNQWVVRAHMINSRRAFAAVTGSDGRIYAIGGDSTDAQGARPEVEAYDPNTDTWTAVAPMPYGRDSFGAVATPNGKIYVFGGECQTPGTAHSCLVYSISGDSWSSNVADIPVDMDANTAVLGNDGNIVVEQRSIGDVAPTVRIYHPQGNTWSKPASDAPATIQRGAVSALAANGLDCFVGGQDDNNNASQFFDVYDSNGDVWSAPYFSLPQAVKFGCASTGGDSRLYLMGGIYGASTSHRSSGYAFNFATDQWDTVPLMHLGRTAAAATMGPDGTVYVLGGNTENGDTDEVESFLPPFLQAIGYPLTAQEGTAFSGAVVTFTDNSSDTAGNFSATINWGDGTTTTGSIVNTGPGAFDVRGAHTYADEGTYNTTVALSDADGEFSSVAGSFTVGDAPLSGSATSPTAFRAVAFSGKVASFSDTNPLGDLAEFSSTVNWGDGSISTGTVVIDPAGGFDVNGGHTYASTGSFSLSVKVTDVGGTVASFAGVVTVSEPPPSVAGVTFNVTEGVSFTGPVASFTDADPNLVAPNFIATITWGDGTSSTGSVSSNGVGGFNVSGTHKYAEEGSFPVCVSVTASGSPAGVGNGTALVADAPLTATGYNLIEKGTTFSDTVATFTDADPAGTASDYTAGIVWGDGKSSNGTIVAFGSGWKVVGTHSYLKRAKYTVTIHIKDVGGAIATATTQINVGPVK